MVSVLDYKKFDTNRLEYSEPSKVKGGSYVAGIKYRNDSNELQEHFRDTENFVLLAVL